MCAAFVAMLLSPGCASEVTEEQIVESRRKFELDEIWGAYKLHSSEKQRPPSGINDLMPYEAGFSLGLRGIKTQAYIVRWKTPIADQGGAPALLAHEKATESDGGLILLNDGTISLIKADEFQSKYKQGGRG
jgi:hypothetical protein